jgi:Chitobiase/beta-hexosaminidase C-terminal domain
MKKALALIAFLFLFCAASARAQGTCPSGSNYVNLSNPFGSLVTLSASAGVTSCWFVSSTAGADTNAGTTEGAPFAHIPGAQNCTNSCNSASISAGVGIIIEGGSSFSSASLPISFTNSGSSGSYIYLGVDLNWYYGGSWTRPVISGSGTYPGTGTNPFIEQYGNYTIVDDIEFTGMYWSNAVFAKAYLNQGGDYNWALRNYFHGWSHATYPTAGEACAIIQLTTSAPPTGEHNQEWFDIADGSDTGEDSCGGFYGGNAVIAASVFSYLSNTQGSNWNEHDNLFMNSVESFDSTAHENTDQDNGGYCGPNNQKFRYNNLYHDNIASDEISISSQDQGGTCNAFVFNVVGYNIESNNGYHLVGPATGGTTGGPVTFFNDTWDVSTQPNDESCLEWGSVSSGSPTSANVYNFHCIYANSGSGLFGPSPAGTPTTVTNLTQTESTACGTYSYCANQTPYVDAPSSGSSPTVGQGTNEYSSLCSTLTDSGALAACEQDTTYACSYNATAHIVSCPNRTTNSRPSSTAWDIGGYEYALSGSCTNPVITPASGAYSSPQTVLMTSNCPIFYTTNDTTPNCSSTSYSGPFSQPIVTSTYVEAIGCESGYTNSGVTTNTYTLAPISTTPGIAQGAAFAELFIDRNFLQGN